MSARRAAWLLAAMLPGVVAAQTDTGALTGRVTDASGAVIQHAQVKVINQDTNIAATVVTNDRGFYFVPDLRPGIYRASASHGGFKLSEQSDIALQVGQTARIDFGLQVGDATERVTVTAQASVLDTETSDRGSVIDGRKIVELPLNDFVELQTTPGVAGFVPFQAFGNSGVGILRGPNLQTLDFSLAKEFTISESQTLQFRSEFFNSLNRANFGIPNITMGPGFGQITTTATSARQIQFALKYRF